MCVSTPRWSVERSFGGALHAVERGELLRWSSPRATVCAVLHGGAGRAPPQASATGDIGRASRCPQSESESCHPAPPWPPRLVWEVPHRPRSRSWPHRPGPTSQTSRGGVLWRRTGPPPRPASPRAFVRLLNDPPGDGPVLLHTTLSTTLSTTLLSTTLLSTTVLRSPRPHKPSPRPLLSTRAYPPSPLYEGGSICWTRRIILVRGSRCETTSYGSTTSMDNDRSLLLRTWARSDRPCPQEEGPGSAVVHGDDRPSTKDGHVNYNKNK